MSDVCVLLATKKQRQTIYRFGISKIPEDLSRFDAAELLEELIDLARHGNKKILKSRVEDLNEHWTGGEIYEAPTSYRDKTR